MSAARPASRGVDPGRLFALAAFVLPAGIYAASASIEPGSWDTAELQGVPYILGIAHPTGFPLYTLLGYVWSHVFAVETVAYRMNLMSGLAIALACVAAYAVAREFGASRPIALCASLWFSVSQDVWAHAARAEAQDLAVACSVWAIYAFVRWMHGAADRWFVAAFALCGLGMAAHPNALWLLPAFVLGALVARRRPSARLWLVAAGVTLAGLALYLYLPLRSLFVAAHGLDPAAGLAGVNGGIFWNYDNPHTPGGLIKELTGSEFQTPTYFAAAFNPVRIGDALWTFVEGTHTQYGSIATLLVIGGFVAAWRRDWRATLVLATACTAALLFSVVYPNESDVGRYRLLASWVVVPLLGALTPRGRRTLLVHVAFVVFLLAGIYGGFMSQRGFLVHSPSEDGRWVIDAVRPVVPPGGVIVTGWLDATSLAYGAYTDGTLPGRIIVSDDKLRLDLYRQWAHNHRVFVLVNPQDVGPLPGAHDFANLDPYHELFEVSR